MDSNLEKLIAEISLRMRLARAVQESENKSGNLSEREVLILEALGSRGRLAVLEISRFLPGIADSTVSTDISRLWREKYVTKKVDSSNQRIKIVELTPKGRAALSAIEECREQRFKLFIEAINVTENERAVFVRLIKKAICHLDDRLKGLAENKRKA